MKSVVKKFAKQSGKKALKSGVSCNISKTSASVSSGVPNTEKLMKARGRRPSAFIVSRCLEPLMKHEARVFDMASQMRQ